MADTVHPDVFGGQKAVAPGLATLEVVEDGVPRTLLRRANSPPDVSLSSVSFFDARCARFYAAEDSVLAYVPSALGVFERLVRIQVALRALIQERVAKLDVGPPRLDDFAEGTAVRRLLSTLSHTSSVDEVKRLGTLAADEVTACREMERTLTQLSLSDPKSVAADLRHKGQEGRELLNGLRVVVTQLSEQSANQLRQAISLVGETRQLAQLASETLLPAGPLHGIGSSLWRHMWEAAQAFSEQESYPGREFPVLDEDALCPLCLQPLAHEARSRLSRLGALAAGSSAAAEAARHHLDTLYTSLQRLDPEALSKRPIIGVLRSELPELATEVDAFCGAAVARAEAMRQSCLAVKWIDEPPDLPQSSESSLVEWIGSLEIRAAKQEALTASGERENLVAQHAELQARRRLSLQVDAIIRLIENLRMKHLLVEAYRVLDTARVTHELGVLTDLMVSERLEKALEVQLEALRCPNKRIRIDRRNAKGKRLTRIVLDSPAHVKPTEVLSEGEQRAVSLAFFLAEVTSTDLPGSIILDDPVSSLDHHCREHVAQTLVAEAKRRQVIVFTHDLVFLLAMLAHAESEAVPVSRVCIRRAGNSVGLVDERLPWPALGTRDRKGVLTDRLQALTKIEKTAPADEFIQQAKHWYAELRETWERAVEELLFKDSVQRYRPSVETKRLEQVRVNEEQTRTVSRAMTECSKRVHDQARAVGGSAITSADMSADLKTFADFYEKNR